MQLAKERMGRPASSNDTQVAIRIPTEWIERADALAPTMSDPGVMITRSDVLRAAMARGLEALEADAPSRRLARQKKRDDDTVANYVRLTELRERYQPTEGEWQSVFSAASSGGMDALVAAIHERFGGRAFAPPVATNASPVTKAERPRRR